MGTITAALNAKVTAEIARCLRLAASGAKGSVEWRERARNLRHFQLADEVGLVRRTAGGWRKGWAG